MRDVNESENFLDLLIQSVPSKEPPPFFAARVASQARVEVPSVFIFIQAIARRLVPISAVLGLLVLFVSYQSVSHRELPLNGYSELLFDEGVTDESIPADFLLSSLRPSD